MKKTSVVLSVVATVLALLALYIAISNPTKDNSANLIATLGVLGTVLIGWQIFAFIDFRSYEKRMSELENRIMEDENRILRTQESVSKTQQQLIHLLEQATKTQDRIMGVYDSINRGQGAVYDGMAAIFRQLKEFDKISPSSLFCQEINWHMSDFDTMLSVFSPDELRGILKKVKDSLNCGITLSRIHKDILLEQINNINRMFEKSSQASDPELRKVMDEALSLIHSIAD